MSVPFGSGSGGNPFGSSPANQPGGPAAQQPGMAPQPGASPQHGATPQAPQQGHAPQASNPFESQDPSHQPGAQQAPNAPFAPETSSGDLTVAGPPMHILFIVLGCAVLGIIIAVLPWGFTGIIGWLIAGPVAILMLGNFTTTDVRRRAGGMYASRPAATTLYWVAAILTLIAVIVTAILTALWVGHL
ncbi:hypothetical protein [uncultured Brevibacterium sp.]|uniref:hypothetical protein n=1 Tax=uncultured Brevibacterium sp. TaxID=189678 RepID=UPI0025CDEADC|nr:hypothetical protein [uncultured Brevibacterium sp.]